MDDAKLMDSNIGEYKRLLIRTSIVLGMTILVVVLCYFWIDRQVAWFVYHHGIEKFAVLRWLTYPPPEVQTWSPLVLTLLCIRRVWGPWSRWQQTLFAACLCVLVADQFRYCLGDIIGRYWPETWRSDNPSLIGTGTYGFHPFQRGDDIGSCPSGHAARIASFGMVWVMALPRTLIVAIVIALPMLLSLVAMNYHFVGDVVAGSALGGIIAAYAVHFAGLNTSVRRS
jgi:membrane-associated phospholipid phosphatase